MLIMTNKLTEDTALVTGGSSGIGRAIAKRFAMEGASVVVADIQQEPRRGGEPTAEMIKNNDGEATYISTDVSDPSQIVGVIDRTTRKYNSLDIMVNNAGVWTEKRQITEIDQDTYDRLMDINLQGVFFGCKEAIKVMKDQKHGGSIINVSSIAGLSAYKNASVYGATKAAIANLTKELAVEQGPNGIRINAVNPGIIETAQVIFDEDADGEFESKIPLRRDGKPEEVASAALFLASDDASYINGHNLVVDGGLIS